MPKPITAWVKGHTYSRPRWAIINWAISKTIPV